jgi:phospholipid-binding lipoprotein MlaA
MKQPALIRRTALTAALVCATAFHGCATRQQPDPYENWNRKVFAFNESFDENLLQPVARGYVAATPEPVRAGVRNFFNNLRDVWSTVNLFLQGRFGEGATSIMRVSVNTTLGLAGFIDIATPMRLERPNEDLGQTLGVWGMGPGAYIVWPILGPSTVRDSFDIPPTYVVSGSALVDGWAAGMAVTSINVVSVRAGLLEAIGLVDDIALDKYAFMRDAYLQRRQNLIYNGDPPDEDLEEPFIDESGGDEAPAAGAAEQRGALKPEDSEPVAATFVVDEAPARSVADPEWALFPAAPTPIAAARMVNGREVASSGHPDQPLAR